MVLLAIAWSNMNLWNLIIAGLMLCLGCFYLQLAVYRLRHRGWRESGWWSRHRILAFFTFPDRPFFLESERRRRSPMSERVGVSVTGLVGFIFVALAIGVLAGRG